MIALGMACCAYSEEAAKEKSAGYNNEAPLPEGWPDPGPFNEVSMKTYPAYRAAVADQDGETRAFWTLFSHIKKNDIPMTAPVEMEMANEDGDLEQQNMSFLYQNVNVGKAGPDGDNVEVKDVPKMKVLSYAWHGKKSDDQMGEVYTKLEKELEAKGLKAKSYRLLGYNGPRTPDREKTWELQAVLE